MENNNIIEAGGFFFIRNFDSGNLGHVEQVPRDSIVPSVNYKTNALETPDYEFNLWTRPDCAGTAFENGNRTWFYFGMQGGQPGLLLRLNLVNLNKQGKMYSQGMAPVTRTLPGKPHWERIKDKPVYCMDENNFVLTFKFRTPENAKSTTFFAFTYPFSFAELQIALNNIDHRFLTIPSKPNLDDIYYCRECVVYSLEGRRVDLLTISSHHGISDQREERLKNLFPDGGERPFKFNKKVIYISARVHPGETPSSFVFNGFLNFLLSRNDPVAIMLRKLYVFKMIPFLNPDGVANGHYRTDTRGVNLNRVYLMPTLEHHPTIYAARALIRYHHFGFEKEEDPITNDENQVLSNEEPQVATRRKSPFRKERVKSSRQNNSPITTSARNREYALAGQVNDMRLNERNTQTSTTSSATDVRVDKQCSTSSLVEQPVVVHDGLGAEIHLSRSDEFVVTGPNPLRQLRDTLKNSISLLIGEQYSMDNKSKCKEDSKLGSSKQKPVTVRVGWCDSCKRAVNELECHMPGIMEILPCSVATTESDSSEVCFFCSNCFKPMVREASPTDIAGNASSLELELSGDSAASNLGTLNSDEQPATDNNGDNARGKVASLNRKKKLIRPILPKFGKGPSQDSNLFLYLDLHGHASKKGIFMYGNHFTDVESSVECMLLPRIMSLNNLHFHFNSCNFTEKNMYTRDRRDGSSREGSGRVAVLKATGLVRSYTLECNYNTGRLVNILPPTAREPSSASGAPSGPSTTPPKYTPSMFEEVGKSLGASILDMTGHHPNSRVPGSEHRSLTGLRDWLRNHTRQMRPNQITMPRLRSKGGSSPPQLPMYSRSVPKSKLTDLDRKENTYIGGKSDNESKKGVIVSPTAGCSSEVGPKLNAKRFTNNMKIITCQKTRPVSAKTQRSVLMSIKKPIIANSQTKTIIKNRINMTKRINEAVEVTKEIVSQKSRKIFNTQRLTRSFRKGNAVNQKNSSKKSVGKDAFQKAAAPKGIAKRLKVSQFGKTQGANKETGRFRNSRPIVNYQLINNQPSTSSSDNNFTSNWDNIMIPTILDGITRSESDVSSVGQMKNDSTQMRIKRGRSVLQKVAMQQSKSDLKKIRLKSNT